MNILHLQDNQSELELKERLKKITHTRHLKVWHDHSEIEGHSHLLVLVAAVYDPALFFTPQEMRDKGREVDVQTLVEEPCVHILGRSSSFTDDQAMYIETRLECQETVKERVLTCSRESLTDVIRYFRGDGPAMQFEAGNKIGGDYPCVGCDADLMSESSNPTRKTRVGS